MPLAHSRVRAGDRSDRRRWRDIPLAISLMVSLLFAGWLAPAARADMSGPAEVLDGDTLEVGGQRIRLYGIDAPDSRQTCERESRLWPCGARAAQTLGRLVDQRPVICYERDRDALGRVHAVCYAAGRELNAAMVQAGMALAYRDRPTDYGPVERRAQTAGRGLWSGAFVAPWDWSDEAVADD